MARTGDARRTTQLVAELTRLPELLLDAKGAFERERPPLAEAIAADPWHIVTGSGNTWPEAFYYGMCILEEMQWIRTRPVHASDFFHGTLELVEPDVSVLLLKGEDAHPAPRRPGGALCVGTHREAARPRHSGRRVARDLADHPGIRVAGESWLPCSSGSAPTSRCSVTIR